MNQPSLPPVVSLAEVFDPEVFRVLALHIAEGSIPEDILPDEPPTA